MILCQQKIKSNKLQLPVHQSTFPHTVQNKQAAITSQLPKAYTATRLQAHKPTTCNYIQAHKPTAYNSKRRAATYNLHSGASSHQAIFLMKNRVKQAVCSWMLASWHDVNLVCTATPATWKILCAIPSAAAHLSRNISKQTSSSHQPAT